IARCRWPRYSFAAAALPRRVLTLMPHSRSNPSRSFGTAAGAPDGYSESSAFLQAAVDEGHQVDELRFSAGAGLRAFQHDRTERARGDDRVCPRRLKLLESDVADPTAWLLFLVGEQQTPAGAAAVGIVAVADRFEDRRAKSGEEVAWFVHAAAIAAEIAGV